MHTAWRTQPDISAAPQRFPAIGITTAKGWVDSYQWGLECSWVDITDLTPGKYVLEIAVNPGRSFQEISFDNNRAAVTVEIPETLGELSTETAPLQVATKEYDLCPSLPAMDSGLSGSKPWESWKATVTIGVLIYTCLLGSAGL